ncbi:uncharacterized protein N7496_010753 [Penicillium cataractarum]|uniref:Uncharacterized protein n=1 Tax=Penicillium cataractarum TaxID=2100454 RepID=A0A9W9RDM3_9EURO|nr:uncharacterized protein N7496_010753 [Penicillium cataractarum]KAJ5358340.1 hypothetical protein N7496_010753 [Penicillium cataractarum]
MQNQEPLKYQAPATEACQFLDEQFFKSWFYYFLGKILTGTIKKRQLLQDFPLEELTTSNLNKSTRSAEREASNAPAKSQALNKLKLLEFPLQQTFIAVSGQFIDADWEYQEVQVGFKPPTIELNLLVKYEIKGLD